MKKTIKKLSLKNLLIIETAFKKTLILTALLSISSSIYAYDFEDDGIYYNILSDSEVEVTKPFSGTGLIGDKRYSGDVIIPELTSYQNKTYTVTSIGYYAFCGSLNLNTVVIPISVTSIRSEAFAGCSDLEWLNILTMLQSLKVTLSLIVLSSLQLIYPAMSLILVKLHSAVVLT